MILNGNTFFRIVCRDSANSHLLTSGRNGLDRKTNLSWPSILGKSMQTIAPPLRLLPLSTECTVVFPSPQNCETTHAAAPGVAELTIPGFILEFCFFIKRGFLRSLVNSNLKNIISIGVSLYIYDSLPLS